MSMPVSDFKSSPERWPVEAMPCVLYFSCPGLALASAMTSASVFAGKPGRADSTLHDCTPMLIGAKSVSGCRGASHLRAGTMVNGPTLLQYKVYPLGLAVATISAAIFLPAPGRFSTTMLTPSDSDILRVMTRAETSAAPPGVKPTRRVNRAIGEGFCCRCIVSKAGDMVSTGKSVCFIILHCRVCRSVVTRYYRCGCCSAWRLPPNLTGALHSLTPPAKHACLITSGTLNYSISHFMPALRRQSTLAERRFRRLPKAVCA